MNYRIESDLLGELQVPAEAYYGVQTQRGINNYKVSNLKMSDFPEYIIAMAYIKLAAVEANHELGVINDEIYAAIAQACRELIDGKMHDQFPTDMVQGGAGTTVNMNANEVIANRALEIMGHQRGEYQYCSPNDHVNCAQSTNDAYPSAFRYAFIRMNRGLEEELKRLIAAIRKKGDEFNDSIKMGRTQLQDAVPMTSGQEFHAFANNLEEEVANLERNVNLLYEINMGGTAIGTGLNAVAGYAELCSPRCGLHEINLPPMAPGSSIMPGKVNPVIPEVTNQVCFKVIGNDTAVCFAAEAGQLQLNVMEPIITECIFESITWLRNVMAILREKCIDGITINREHNLETVKHSIGIVTALNPVIGYKASTKIAKEALETGKSVYNLVLEHGLLQKEQLDELLNPTNMLASH